MTATRRATLGDICIEGGGFIRTGPFGSQLHQSDYVDDPAGIPVVMPKDMTGGRIDLSTIARIDRETAARLSHHLLTAGDIVLSRRGDVGRTAWISNEDLPALCGTGSMRIHPGKAESVHGEYLRYFMRSRVAIDYLERHAVGATMPNLNAAIVAGLPVILPPLQQQRVVANVLASIEELINNNQGRIELLEQTAQAIYREWFVHFRCPGHEDVPLVDSPVGPIPVGWETKPLAAIASLDRTTVQPRLSPDEMFDHYSIPAFDDRHLPTFDAGDTIRSSKFLLTRPAVLVSKLNPRIERTWLVDLTPGRRSVGSTEFLVLRPTPGFSLEYLYLLVRSAAFQERLRELSGGTSTSHQRAKPDDFLEISVFAPPTSLASQFPDVVGPPLSMARTLRVAIRELEAIRDLLLPKLVTGQIDISNLDLDALAGSVA